MNRSDWSIMFNKFVRLYRQVARRATGVLPRRMRFAVFRNMIRCDVAPPDKLVLKVAETREELEDCFSLLHDAYVRVGFMKPDPSGMRATLYHALPTTTTLLAKYDGRIVGTISLIRESPLGFPMQKIFNIEAIRKAGGNIAEVSALAVHRRFQAMGGVILFPLMKFMYEYSTKLFDTRHLVIAVNPRHIGFYESILFFKRLKQNPVEHYDFVNGAPAVGAHVDLKAAPEIYRRYYGNKEPAKNLYRYFIDLHMPNIIFPDKRFYTTNDPVMTPELLDYFFNQRTAVFAGLNDDEIRRFHAIYDLPAYKTVLPPLPQGGERDTDYPKRHQRFSVVCPAELVIGRGRLQRNYALQVVECSMNGFRARSGLALPLEVEGTARIDLGRTDQSHLRVTILRKARSDRDTYVLKVEEPDLAWRKFVSALRKASIHSDLDNATRYLE
ncbi:MAG TPA: hypothetical protein VMV33_04850 [Rhodocyclaceae bacterium]|nr:hypothetical protein [Rhodocyclaceae bacterium]